MQATETGPVSEARRIAKFMGLPDWAKLDDLGLVERVAKGFPVRTATVVMERIDPVTGPLAFVRLLGDRNSIEKVTQTWDRLVVDREAELSETAEVIEELARRVPVVVFINNHYAGHSPATARQLRERLGLPEPVPPERPPKTLFDCA